MVQFLEGALASSDWNIRKNKHDPQTSPAGTMSHRRIFIAYALTTTLFACADSDGGAEQTSLKKGSLDPQIATQSALDQTLALNSAVSSAFGRVKADLEADP